MRTESVELFDENPITESDLRVPIHLWNLGIRYKLKGWDLLF